MKIAIYTLGCKVNQYETQAMEAELLARGHELVPFEERADGYIINTCTVTAVSDKKSRQVIRRARKENPEAVIGVCGCYAQTSPEAVKALEVDLISGTAGRMAFLDDLEAAIDSPDFLRCHRSYIVNMNYIANMTTGDFILQNGCHVPISATMRAKAKQSFCDWMFQKVREGI